MGAWGAWLPGGLVGGRWAFERFDRWFVQLDVSGAPARRATIGIDVPRGDVGDLRDVGLGADDRGAQPLRFGSAQRPTIRRRENRRRFLEIVTDCRAARTEGQQIAADAATEIGDRCVGRKARGFVAGRYVVGGLLQAALREEHLRGSGELLRAAATQVDLLGDQRRSRRTQCLAESCNELQRVGRVRFGGEDAAGVFTCQPAIVIGFGVQTGARSGRCRNRFGCEAGPRATSANVTSAPNIPTATNLRFAYRASAESGPNLS